jgi:hypothetical protein
VRLGLTWVWLGLEGKHSQYMKIQGINTRALVRELQSHGIRVLGSTIIGLEYHTPENIDGVIDDAVNHQTDFHQFMLYTPLPGTPLSEELSAQGRMRDESEYDFADIHGQSVFNFRHLHLRDGEESKLIVHAFQRDFEINGPSLVRIARTVLAGWKRYKNHPDSRLRRRFAWEARDLPTTFSAIAGAVRFYYRKHPAMLAKIDALIHDLHSEFGLTSWFYSVVVGRYACWRMRREERRLAQGWSYEPPTFYEQNEAAQELAPIDGPQAVLRLPVTCRVVSSPNVELVTVE